MYSPDTAVSWPKLREVLGNRIISPSHKKFENPRCQKGDMQEELY